MQKIPFKDRYRLTQAVLNRLKTMTRRTVRLPRTFRGIEVAGFRKLTNKQGEWCTDLYDEDERTIEGSYLKPPYEIGEVVAIAQSYETIFHAGNCPDDFFVDSSTINKKYCGAGFKNKLFVRADLMPHHIRITNVKIGHLQDISDDECLREGIIKEIWDDGTIRYKTPNWENVSYLHTDTAISAFEWLIDKVSGKGTFASNPWVWAYEFELID